LTDKPCYNRAMSKVLVIANWKMNPPTMRDAKKLFEATRKALDKCRNVSMVIAPPAIFLSELADYGGKKIEFASQDALAAAGGAYTGRISLAQAKDAG